MKPEAQSKTNHVPLMPPRILIYRSELLAYSETFIAAQASALRTSIPIFAGLRRIRHSLDLPCQSFAVAEGDGLAQRALRYAFLQTGRAPRLIAHLRAQQPALLHAHFAIDAAEALPLARALSIPLIVTLHGYDVMSNDETHSASRRGRVYLARRQRLFREASLFLCVSEAIRQKAITRGFPSHKLRVHAIGIDVARFQPAGHLSGAPDILFVGRLVEKKGCAHLIHAMCEVRRVLPQARMIVLGDGPERSRLEAEAHRWGSQAIFLGVQSGDQVRQWMASSRVLAVPSITARDGDAEGLPTVLYEALAMGLPVACFRTSGIPELVRDEVEGLFAEEGDEAGLARNLLRLCQDDALAHRISKAGRHRVEQSFELSAQTAKLEAIYAEVVESRSNPLPASGQARVNGVFRQAPSKQAAAEPDQPSASPQISTGAPAQVLIPDSWQDHQHASHIPR
jgi:glycosyltransferase involved in cell wall biosynthesis